LLLQDALQHRGLGNQHDMVGRCFMDHPAITLGTLIPGCRRYWHFHPRGGLCRLPAPVI
jgi:hypothetical protein